MTQVIARPAPGRRMHPVALIDGLPMTKGSPQYVLAEIGRAIDARETGHYIAVTNPENMFHGQRQADIGAYIRNADFSVCDGIGVAVVGWAWGQWIRRFPGPTLQLEASREGVQKGWRHFYYGGKEGVADEMARRLKEKYPGLIVCGTYCPPFRPLTPEEDNEVVKLINDANPDIVWIGLGVPTKERWIAAHLGRLKAPWLIGVGAAFDYHSGAIPWAPAPIRAIGMEWLYRLIIEPKMRLRRTWWHLIYVAQTFLKGLVTLRFLFPQKSLEN